MHVSRGTSCLSLYGNMALAFTKTEIARYHFIKCRSVEMFLKPLAYEECHQGNAYIVFASSSKDMLKLTFGFKDFSF